MRPPRTTRAKRAAWSAAALGAAILLAALPAMAQVAPGDLLVTSRGDGLVYRLDPDAPAAMPPQPVPIGGDPIGSPRGLAVDRNGFLMVADNDLKQLLRIDPVRNLRQLAAQLSAFQSALREVAAASDGRLFVADPGIVPLLQPPLPAIRGVTYFPLISLVDVNGGVVSGRPVAGCALLVSGQPTCGNLYLPAGIEIASEEPELVLLVADLGDPAENGVERVHHGVIRVFPDRLFNPPLPPTQGEPPYPVTGEGVNDELFCAPGPFATPRSLAVDRSPGREGSVLVTDSGRPADPGDPEDDPVPPRVIRVVPEPGGCSDPEDTQVVAQGGLLQRPIGIAVADDGTIFVADELADTVFRIDPDTGVVEPLSTQGSIAQAADLQIYDPRPAPYFVAETFTPALLRVDPALPARTTVSSGGSLVAPQTLEVLPGSAGLLVADPTAGAVIDVALGGSQLVRSQGGRLTVPTSASREATGTYLVTDLGDATAEPPIPPAVIRVDPTQPFPANQSLVSEGGLLVHPVAGAIDGNGFLIVADAGKPAADPEHPETAIPPRIVRISPTLVDIDADERQKELFSAAPLVQPVALSLDEAGGVILVADRGDPAADPPAPSVLRFARLASPPGEAVHVRTFPADDLAPPWGPLLVTPAGIAVDSDRSILVSDAGLAATADDARVIRIDALSGLQSEVAIGAAGETLDLPTGIGVQAPAAGAFPDQDGDGFADAEDNCIAIPNTDQRDTDVPPDLIGNVCDADFDDGGTVGNSDFNLLRRSFGESGCDRDGDDQTPPDTDCDMDGDGLVGNFEFNAFRDCFTLSPGQSGLLLFDPQKQYCYPALPAP